MPSPRKRRAGSRDTTHKRLDLLDTRPRAGALGLLVSCASGMEMVRLAGKNVLLLGRGPECDVVIEDVSVSRKHARLTLSDPPIIEDLGSTNGIRVQGRRLASGERAEVAIGAAFELGTTTLVLQRAGSLRPAAPSSRPNAASVAPPSIRATIYEPAHEAIVADPSMHGLYALLDVMAPTSLSVLVLGETGVGKEVYARAVHLRSLRASGPFLQLNCAAFPESLLEAELFGYEKGAFTGAVQAKAGLFESASGGTVFLDEVGEMPLATQAKLLRVLENGEVRRLGSVKAKVVDVRFVAATNRDLRRLIADSRFRSDLFFRLSGFSVTLPPLRARKNDIAPLARHFVQRAAFAIGRPLQRLTEDAIAMLERHDWPGNARELRNVVERALALSRDDSIDAEDLLRAEPDAFGTRTTIETAALRPPMAMPTEADLRAQVRTLEKQRIADALARCGGNQSRAAKLLGISRSMLSDRLDEYGLVRPRKGRVDDKL